MGHIDEERVRPARLTSREPGNPGSSMLTRWADHSVEGLTQMAAVGLGLPADTFKDAGRYGYPTAIAPFLFRLKH